jgi:flagellar motor protein MotB
VLVVLKDIWGLSAERAQSVAEWAAAALVEAAIREAQTAA